MNKSFKVTMTFPVNITLEQNYKTISIFSIFPICFIFLSLPKKIYKYARCG